MRKVSALKGAGYLTSTASVVLLAIVAYESASEEPLLLACLIAGVVTSILGMCLRWRSHRIEQHDQDAELAKAKQAS